MEHASRVGLVTGGATGIGRAICLQLARSGVENVIVNFHTNQSAALATVDELTRLGCNAVPVAGDVSDQTSVNKMFDYAVDKFGRLDVLVNNAGFTQSIPLNDLASVTDDVWNKIMDVNLRGAFYCSRSAVRLLKASHGAIINVASVSAIRPSGSCLPYMVAKAGLVQLTRALALALAPDVRVNAVLPGFVPTGWHTRLVGSERADELANAAALKTPLGRLTTPQDVGAAVVSIFLLGFMTGQCLVVDGGRELIY